MINKNKFLILSRRDDDAGIFALDGVINPTANFYAADWKSLSDPCLEPRSYPQRFLQAFDPENNYRRYADGKLYYEA